MSRAGGPQAPPAALPPIEVAFPDLARHASGNSGIRYAWTFAASRPGPHVVIQALTHGNEVCGAIALDRLLREELRPVRGTLSVVFANIDAYSRFDRARPFASRCVDEDFNRLWTTAVLDGERVSSELERARELKPLYDRTDFLLDIHSMSEPCLPLAMAGRRRKGVALARALGMPENIVVDAGHAAGRRLRDYAFFDDEADPRAALLIECGQHWEAAAPGVAREATLRFLRHFGMAEEAWLARELDDIQDVPQRLVEVTATVTIASDDFRFTMPVGGLQTIARAGTVYAIDGGSEIRTPHDDCVLIMPTRNPKRGETAVRLGRYAA
ncbi:MAG: succinylglutamate desuccinylase/aspartoacylase family protein [Burkholderiales bacterium]